MEIEFDPLKDEANRKKHGISLAAAADMDLSQAKVIEDRRFDYGEARFLAYAPINGRLHVLYYTVRRQLIRPIGLRKANRRERTRFEQSP